MKAKPKQKTKLKIPSVGFLARLSNPLENADIILRKLKAEKTESRHLEWKLTPPFGMGVTIKNKYRMVKALISFANTDGGFIVFGVDPHGNWIGFSEAEIKETDPAMIVELINGCITPEITGLNYSFLRFASRLYPVLHTPPSPLMPHVTTKEIVEKLPSGKSEIYLQRHAVYCRYYAKSDLATATQYARIITRRTELFRTEMLRRVKEVEVPAMTTSAIGGFTQSPIIRVVRNGNDKTLPAMRITRNPSEATGLVVQEELSEGIFKEINNVLDANHLLASNDHSFVFGDNIYYRIYAERQHVHPTMETFELLARTALVRVYGPSLFWLLRLSPAKIAELIHVSLEHPRSNHVHLICRLATLLGFKVTSWLLENLSTRWGTHPQPPDFFFSFKKMVASFGESDSRLIALQLSPNARIDMPNESQKYLLSDLLNNPQLTGNLLSKACLSVFKGSRDLRQCCRQLDIVAYGSEIIKFGDDVAAELSKK